MQEVVSIYITKTVNSPLFFGFPYLYFIYVYDMRIQDYMLLCHIAKNISSLYKYIHKSQLFINTKMLKFLIMTKKPQYVS